jgi:hypothetical protein
VHEVALADRQLRHGLELVGDPVYATFLRRPATVQIDTIRASLCQDSIRAS